ncbi:hypothetical protein QZH41_011485, partial [Actinostola sp. cb2023]
CKLWGYLLRHMFGISLGSGDYGHLTVEHSSMLLRIHRSFVKYSNQGFEASHKVHRALYSRATSHDQAEVGQSLEQILTHWLTEMMLCLRIQFCKAYETIKEGKHHFHYRGCGWPNKRVDWNEQKVSWITTITTLFVNLYGKNALKYVYLPDKGTRVCDQDDPRHQLCYNHEKWEKEYATKLDCSSQNVTNAHSPVSEPDSPKPFSSSPVTSKNPSSGSNKSAPTETTELSDEDEPNISAAVSEPDSPKPFNSSPVTSRNPPSDSNKSAPTETTELSDEDEPNISAAVSEPDSPKPFNSSPVTSKKLSSDSESAPTETIELSDEKDELDTCTSAAALCLSDLKTFLSHL